MREYGRELSIIHRYSRIYMSRTMEAYGISGRLIPYIMLLSSSPGITQDAVARKFQIDKGSVARTIALLVEKGLATKKENPDNKRENLIYPTGKMIEISKRVKDSDKEFDAVLYRGFTEDEKKQVAGLLSRMSENLIEAIGKEGCLHDRDTEIS